MKVIEAVQELIKMGLSGVEYCYDHDKNMFFYDLNTKSKSHLFLYDDWHVEGRYNYHYQIHNEGWESTEDILSKLFWEFRSCDHGRDFYNTEWMEIGVKLGLIEKQVITKVIYE